MRFLPFAFLAAAALPLAACMQGPADPTPIDEPVAAASSATVADLHGRSLAATHLELSTAGQDASLALDVAGVHYTVRLTDGSLLVVETETGLFEIANQPAGVAAHWQAEGDEGRTSLPDDGPTASIDALRAAVADDQALMINADQLDVIVPVALFALANGLESKEAEVAVNRWIGNAIMQPVITPAPAWGDGAPEIEMDPSGGGCGTSCSASSANGVGCSITCSGSSIWFQSSCAHCSGGATWAKCECDAT